MTDRGLNNRLRQRSRRAGIMIGVSMALTIMVCVASFSVIYSALDRFTTDFISNDDPIATERPVQQQADPTEPPADTSQQGNDESNDAAAPTATTEATDNQIEPQATSEVFTPDYQIDANQSINLRSGPGTNNDVVTTLTIAQPLQYLGQEQRSDNPGRDGLAPDQVWMQFRTEDGDVGWVREIDVTAYDENA
jgi:hypothetical protein